MQPKSQNSGDQLQLSSIPIWFASLSAIRLSWANGEHHGRGRGLERERGVGANKNFVLTIYFPTSPQKCAQLEKGELIQYSRSETMGVCLVFTPRKRVGKSITTAFAESQQQCLCKRISFLRNKRRADIRPNSFKCHGL